MIARNDTKDFGLEHGEGGGECTAPPELVGSAGAERIADASGPPCLTKGGVTNWQGTVGVDFWRATLTGEALNTLQAHYIAGSGEMLPRSAKGFHRAERFNDGMVRRWEPWSDNADGTEYESWEFPGTLAGDTAERLGRLLRGVEGVKPTLIHLAWDVQQQGYPRPWAMRDQHERLRPRSDNKAGRRFEGEDGSQTWYCGTKSADVRLRVYEKGKQQQSMGIEAPTDWVRVEFELAGAWAPVLAWSAFLRGELPGFFAQLCRWYFLGEAVDEFFPEGTAGYILGGEPRKPSPAAATLAALVRQYGMVIESLEEHAPGLLVDLLALRRSSGRMEETRRRRFVEGLAQCGQDDLLRQVDFILNIRV